MSLVTECDFYHLICYCFIIKYKFFNQLNVYMQYQKSGFYFDLELFIYVFLEPKELLSLCFWKCWIIHFEYHWELVYVLLKGNFKLWHLLLCQRNLSYFFKQKATFSPEVHLYLQEQECLKRWRSYCYATHGHIIVIKFIFLIFEFF